MLCILLDVPNMHPTVSRNDIQTAHKRDWHCNVRYHYNAVNFLKTNIHKRHPIT